MAEASKIVNSREKKHQLKHILAPNRRMMESTETICQTERNAHPERMLLLLSVITSVESNSVNKRINRKKSEAWDKIEVRSAEPKLRSEASSSSEMDHSLTTTPNTCHAKPDSQTIAPRPFKKSCFALPPFPQKARQSVLPSTPPPVDGLNTLHLTCRLHGPGLSGMISGILKSDPEAIRRKCSLSRQKVEQQALFQRRRQLTEPYQLPINLALLYQADKEVLQRLIEAGPDVLTLHDGNDLLGSLTVALLTNPQSFDTIDQLLNANPRCAMVSDRRQNLPLHTACAKGASLDVIRRIYEAYPEALHQVNFNRETPMQISQRNIAICPDSVANFLYACSINQELRSKIERVRIKAQANCPSQQTMPRTKFEKAKRKRDLESKRSHN